MKKGALVWWLKKAVVALVPVLGFVCLFFAGAALDNFPGEDTAENVILALMAGIMLAPVYGLYRVFISWSWQLREAAGRTGERVRARKAWFSYLYGLAGLFALLGLILMEKGFMALVAMVSASAFAVYLAHLTKRMDRDAEALQQQNLDGPPNLHAGLSAEVDLWREGGLLADMPAVEEIGKLSGLIIAEGMEDVQDQPKIEQHYGQSMPGLIDDLGKLRKLLAGADFLTDSQGQEIETLKANVTKQRDALQALYQGIAG